MTNYSGCNKMA